MKNTVHKKRFIKRHMILLFVFLLVMMVLLFFQFTSIGYRMTVPYRNFTELTDNVYVENRYSGDKEELNAIVEEATARVSTFWGDTKSSPVIIISDSTKTLQKLGGDHDTATVIFWKAYSYISLSNEYLNVDILAHEMTHAELHARLYEGRLAQNLVPAWFDEGVATQNDYREKYDDTAWNEVTQNGAKEIDFTSMDSYAEFNAGESADRVYRYIVSRHEVKAWVQQNKVEGLKDLLSRVNQGENFDALYHNK